MRHSSVRRRLDLPLARRDGTRALPESPRVDDHGRRRWLKWNTGTALEGRIAEAGRCDKPRAPRPSLSHRHRRTRLSAVQPAWRPVVAPPDQQTIRKHLAADHHQSRFRRLAAKYARSEEHTSEL